MAAPNIVTLRSSDGEIFKVDEVVAKQLQTIEPVIDGGCAENAIPLLNVNSRILEKVIEYCKKHVKTRKGKELAVDELKAWDADFVKVDQATLFDLILAAHYLDIKSLFDLTCQTVADMIKAMIPESIRGSFNTRNYLYREEVEKARRENEWSFE